MLYLPYNLIFSCLDTNLTVLDPDPYSQYRSGSGGAISIRIPMDPDPDPVSEHCRKHLLMQNIAFYGVKFKLKFNLKFFKENGSVKSYFNYNILKKWLKNTAVWTKYLAICFFRKVAAGTLSSDSRIPVTGDIDRTNLNSSWSHYCSQQFWDLLQIISQPGITGPKNQVISQPLSAVFRHEDPSYRRYWHYKSQFSAYHYLTARSYGSYICSDTLLISLSLS